jgi:hypothetical protein
MLSHSLRKSLKALEGRKNVAHDVSHGKIDQEKYQSPGGAKEIQG